MAFDRQFDSRSLARFQKEAEAAIELQHLNICSTREFGVNEEGIPFLVMDYIEGTSLAEILSKEAHLPQQRALDIMEGICAGLEHAHAAGVIHRDIKPANIILAKDKSGSEAVKIVDFGIAKLIREDESGPDLTQTGEVFGTPKYMSPEQCLGKKVDQRGDIYALGCIFYEMLSGSPPFCNQSSIQILFAHVNDEPASLKPSCGKQVQAVLDRCLKKDASQRYLNMSQLLADLRAIRGGGSLVFARPRGIQPRSIIAIVILFVLVCFFTQTISGIGQERRSWAEQKKRFAEVHEQVVLYKVKDPPAAERLLERSLEIAKEIRSDSLIASTLQELSDIETAQGKTIEAADHKKALENRSKVGDMSKFFIQIATLLICVGIGLFILINLVFSKEILNSFQKIFSKKN